MEHGFTHNIDPAMFHLFGLRVNYYGLIFMVMFWITFFVWLHYIKRAGHKNTVATDYLPWFVITLLAGARLGHCFFYEPMRFLSDPVSIIFFWNGGLSSHGATVGILIGLYFYAKSRKLLYWDIVDRFSPSAAIGAAAVRLGNFMNSEIVGRPTDLPWGVRFMRYDNGIVARHPSQLYEFLLGLVVLVTLIVVDHKAGKEKRPTGLITAVFSLVYFGGRFFVEFTKDSQGVDDGWILTMGQLLCIPFMVLGIIMLRYSKRHPAEERVVKEDKAVKRFGSKGRVKKSRRGKARKK